ncbi:MAG: DUF268 domain-containing protein [Polynucleobacter sp.]|uniref:DUF268 domain-containing protein n=1 Tax=Polynucleobacter sp. TaxID=2029855 RepID=UPI002724C70E|nr:DUF268 domain-containing protein [Polynucleobacter sp.]MDO8713799.1 DUF268 domain-containing protein [Polynucleobacter sp.]
MSKMERKVKYHALKKVYGKYKEGINEQHPFSKFQKSLIGDTSADPLEFFSHYDAYSFWLAQKLMVAGNGKSILDVGNLKVTNGMLSLTNDVTSLVLADCEDKISSVSYVIQDISKPLNLSDNSFDVFTSSVSLHLVGLGRYGDEVNPNALIQFVDELNRVMKEKSELIFSISYGRNFLAFNEGWKFDIETIKSIFGQWELVDWLVDNKSSHTVHPFEQRFTKDLSLDGWGYGEYRVIFLHFKR